MGIVESLLLSAVLFFAGAIVEKNTEGKVTQVFFYMDTNATKECKNK